MNNISAIILTKNEEKKIEKLLVSLSFCNEILVIDDESTDTTVQKAVKAGAHILIHPKNNDFSSQRNWAMTHAKNEWALFVDADEELSTELKEELIKGQLQQDVYAIPRRDFFWNTELKHGETRAARTKGIVRLMKKNSGEWKGIVHEEFITNKSVGKLEGFLNHYSHDSLASFVTDINLYSTIRAKELSHQKKGVSVLELILFPPVKFIYTYIVLLGFLDGAAGFAYSFIMSFHSFLVRAKLLMGTL